MELSVTFTGTNLEAVQKQAAAFAGVQTITGATPKIEVTKAALKNATTKKAAAPVVEDEDDASLELPGDVEDGSDFDLGADEEIEAPVKKKAAAPKLTEKEVNAAAKAHAGTHGRAATLAILKKQFKVQSILELKPDQYASVIKALK